MFRCCDDYATQDEVRRPGRWAVAEVYLHTRPILERPPRDFFSHTRNINQASRAHTLIARVWYHVSFFIAKTMSASLSRTETFSLLALSAACVGIIANTFHGDGEPLIASLAFSGIAFAFTFSLIRWLGDTFMAAGLKGRDMSKVRKVEM